MPEDRIEITFDKDNLPKVVDILKTHPYETPCIIAVGLNEDDKAISISNREDVEQAIIIYALPEYCEQVKEALFGVGVGVIENYDHCSWNSGPQEEPFKGSPRAEMDTKGMCRVEMVCARDCIDAVNQVLEELKASNQLTWFATWPCLTFPYLKTLASEIAANLA